MATIISINACVEVTGGADRFFHELNKLMIENGQRVLTFTCRPWTTKIPGITDEIRYFIEKDVYPAGGFSKFAGLISVFYDRGILKNLENIVRQEKPSIAHIHNIYHRIPYTIISVLKKHGIKTVWWIHDYKWICPNHQLFTKGQPCKRCSDGNYVNAIIHRCQSNSILKSAIACCLAYYVSLNNYRDKIDQFITPSQSAYSNLKEFDFPISKVKVLPHFNYGTAALASDSTVTKKPATHPYALYIGRIEENKGISHLVRAFGRSGYPLRLIGTGSYESKIKKYCSEKKFTAIEFFGYIPPEQLSNYYREALFVVVPSVWYEVFGLTILEAFNFSKPVVAADIGAIPEIVENGKSGLLYRPGDTEDFCKKTKWMFDNPESARQMGLDAQKIAADRFSSEKYWEELQKLHYELIKK